MVEFIIDLSSLIFAYIGAVIIIYGGAIATFKTLMTEFKRSDDLDYHEIRRNFTHKIIFGLDFLIAGDILKSIVAPTHEEIIILGAIVGIRSILGYFLGKELSEFDK
ncbi:MAG: DUF1622 domain-containing protein [Methanosarcinaceae archaeon]|nr:DUF1622 domain-containing protein [Methanosarcinaceae archaeon]MDF1533352.1 DUF1622 domain-containing protein [Methanosarcinaceae archaeon]